MSEEQNIEQSLEEVNENISPQETIEQTETQIENIRNPKIRNRKHGSTSSSES